MATNDTRKASSRPADQPTASVEEQRLAARELVEILRQLGAHRRKVYEQTYGNPPWTREQSDAYWHHPLVWACKWLEQRLAIDRHDLVAAAFRLTTPLGLRGMAPLIAPDGEPDKEDKGQPDWLWMTSKFRELDRDGTTTRLWQLLAEDCPAILADAGMLVPSPAPEAQPPAAKPPSGQNPPTKSITSDEAEVVARRLGKKDVTFRHLTAKDMAVRIQNESGKPCSDSLVKQLPFWREAMTATGRGRKRGGARVQGQKRGTAARPMNFSKDLEAVTGEGKAHEVLEELVEAEETAEAERALREQAQAIALVNRSRLPPKAKAETIAQLEAGKMTAQQVGDMVSLLRQDPVLTKKRHSS